jgi:hypothetical protein
MEPKEAKITVRANKERKKGKANEEIKIKRCIVFFDMFSRVVFFISSCRFVLSIGYTGRVWM